MNERKQENQDFKKALSALDSDLVNTKQRLFCLKYIETLNVRESYMYAYPNSGEDSAVASGHRLLGQENIKEYIRQVVKEYGDNINNTVGCALTEVKKMAFSEETPPTVKLQALKMVGQTEGLFTDKIEISNKDIIVELE